MKYKIIEPQHYQQIQARYHINSLLAKVIESRQYDEKTLKEMMNPRLIYHDFSLFEEADMTLERIHEAIEQHEKICNYDCDGILATTILVQAFLELGVKVGYHIPHRFEDGYGLNVKRVEQMAEKGYTLIITVDNGVKAFKAVERANELGIDVIINLIKIYQMPVQLFIQSYHQIIRLKKYQEAMLHINWQVHCLDDKINIYFVWQRLRPFQI